MATNPSISIPIVPLLRHFNNQINFKIHSLSFPLSGLNPNSNGRQNTTPVRFQCRCTNEENHRQIKTFGPIRDGISNLTSSWMSVVSSPILEFFLLKREPQNVSFDELMGVDDIIKQFRQYICVLQAKSGSKSLPQGVFLFGPPGTGKTTLVHAMAHEAKVSFFPLSARDVATRAGALRIKRLFNEARRWSPSIVYIEDLDIIAGEERNPKSTKAIKQLFTEMEKGYYRNRNEGRLVLVIGATNRLWSLDEKLHIFRHFHRTFRVAEPNEDCRRKMFGSYLEEFILEEYKEAICNLVAKSTPGLVWGDLQEIGDESTRLAARREGDHVSMVDVRQAIERVNVNLRIEDR